ncbi:hypothetical protein BJ165DRAFT_1041746 [Panaeolus papilionaceus]|nr:hypothetical protein BJ165DRAFT_1041746 [Panaeolus papilionaceus]
MLFSVIRRSVMQAFVSCFFLQPPVGNDLRKAVADGWPRNDIIGSRLREGQLQLHILSGLLIQASGNVATSYSEACQGLSQYNSLLGKYLTNTFLRQIPRQANLRFRDP